MKSLKPQRKLKDDKSLIIKLMQKIKIKFN
jgi:hypothetical protein